MLRLHIVLMFVVLLITAPVLQLPAAPLNPRDFNDFGLWEREPNGGTVFDESAIEDGRLSADAVRQLAENGNVTAQRVLGIRLTFGEESTNVERQDGVDWLNKAAGAGDVQAQEHLAEAVIRGVGTEVDQRSGLKWLKNAASAGSVEALFRAGDLQIRGSEQVRDEEAGFLAIRDAARKKHPKALERLAQCYRFGIGTPQSTFKFLLAARHALKANPDAGYFAVLADVIFWGAIILSISLLLIVTKILRRSL